MGAADLDDDTGAFATEGLGGGGDGAEVAGLGGGGGGGAEVAPSGESSTKSLKAAISDSFSTIIHTS